MGWTGSDDTLAQVELTFPSAAAAVAYARRQGLRYLLQGADDPDTQPAQTRRPPTRIPLRQTYGHRTCGLGDWNGSNGRPKTSRDRYGVKPRITRVPRTCLMTTIFRRRRSRTYPPVGALESVPDRTGSLQERTAIRALTFGRGDRRTVRSGRDAGQHVSAPDSSDGARL